MAGAHVTQMVSALLMHGPAHLRTVLADLAAWMQEHEWDSLAEMRGNMSLEASRPRRVRTGELPHGAALTGARLRHEQLSAFLHEFPALRLFLSILLGSFIGRFHFKGVGFGAVVGTLIAGIVIGIVAKPELPDLLRWAFFYLFLFSIGYSVGPQFFGSLKKDALPQIVLAVVVAVSGLATVIAVSAVFGFNEGLAVGLLSGGMTQSAALGTGLSAIAELPIPEPPRHARSPTRRSRTRLPTGSATSA